MCKKLTVKVGTLGGKKTQRTVKYSCSLKALRYASKYFTLGQKGLNTTEAMSKHNFFAAKKEARKLFRANHQFIFPQTVKIQRNDILRCKVNLEKKIGILQRIWAKNDTEVEWSTDYSNFPKLDTSPPKCRLNSTKHISP